MLGHALIALLDRESKLLLRHSGKRRGQRGRRTCVSTVHVGGVTLHQPSTLAQEAATTSRIIRSAFRRTHGPARRAARRDPQPLLCACERGRQRFSNGGRRRLLRARQQRVLLSSVQRSDSEPVTIVQPACSGSSRCSPSPHASPAPTHMRPALHLRTQSLLGVVLRLARSARSSEPPTIRSFSASASLSGSSGPSEPPMPTTTPNLVLVGAT
jgi:hypothetical protein